MKMQILPAKVGLEWVKLGIKSFMNQPIALGGLVCMFMALISVLSIVPFLGSALALMLMPAATLGLMVATLQSLSGKFPMPQVLAVGLRAGKQRLREMIVLGSIYAVLMSLIFALLIWMTASAKIDPKAKISMAEAAQQQMDFLSSAWPAAFLYIPLTLAFWHAPALVHWYGMPAVKTLFFSLVACLKNWRAYTVYALAWTLLMIVVSSALSIIFAILGLASMILHIMFPMVLILTAMFYTSLYFTFRDTFEHAPSQHSEIGQTPPI